MPMGWKRGRLDDRDRCGRSHPGKGSEEREAPKGLEGPALTLIITGIMALAFTAFSG